MKTVFGFIYACYCAMLAIIIFWFFEPMMHWVYALLLGLILIMLQHMILYFCTTTKN